MGSIIIYNGKNKLDISTIKCPMCGNNLVLREIEPEKSLHEFTEEENRFITNKQNLKQQIFHLHCENGCVKDLALVSTYVEVESTISHYNFFGGKIGERRKIYIKER